MKSTLVLVAAALMVASCAKQMEGRPLSAAECRELAQFEVASHIKEGRMVNITDADKDALIRRNTRMCVDSGQFTTAYMTCIKTSRKTAEWDKCAAKMGGEQR